MFAYLNSQTTERICKYTFPYPNAQRDDTLKKLKDFAFTSFCIMTDCQQVICRLFCELLITMPPVRLRAMCAP